MENTVKILLSLLLTSLVSTPLLATEPPVVIDTDGPSEGAVRLGLTELWRAGDEDGDVLFGRITALKGGADEEIYVLDQQLCHVEVFGAGGEHLRTLSREGSGPGEVRQPIGVVVLPDDQIAIGSGFPGKLIVLGRDGTPIATRYPIGEPADGNIGVMISVGAGGGVLGATGGRLVMTTPTESYANRFLAVGSVADGGEIIRILEKKTPLDPTGRTWDEKADYYFDGRWDVSADGLIYVPTRRDAYLVEVYDRHGVLQRSFGRDLPQRRRTQADKDLAGPVINAFGERIDDEWDICDTDPAIQRVMVDPDDGSVWVLTPQGANDQPDGVVEVWDVFSADGEYLRQLSVPSDGEIREGTCYLVGNHRLAMLRGGATPWIADPDAVEDEEEEPVEVICYRIEGA